MKHLFQSLFAHRLAIAIAFPIIVLLCLMLYKQHIVSTGQVVKLAIIGFDPRDLLSGHYLRYQVDYQTDKSCDSAAKQSIRLCLKPQRYFISPYDVIRSECQLYLSGYCKAGQFIAGIERFYIPEQYALQLDKLVRDARGELQISVTPQGKAIIQTLLIDGQPWQEKLYSAQ
jgi:uncharacterized membrane-anchored protein